MARDVSSKPAEAIAEVIEVSLLTGGFDRPYAFGLTMAMAAQDVRMEVIGSDEVDSPEMHSTPGVAFVNLWGNQRPDVSRFEKVWRIFARYGRLLRYAVTAKPRIFHILWNNKFHVFDRTLLMLYYKAMGRKVVFTAHNVNAGKRDGNDSRLNRFSLRAQYRLSDHIFVHTEKMKTELKDDFGIGEQAVTVIPFGINNSVPDTAMTPAEARAKLGIGAHEKVILFFGAIRPYKGLEHLVDAFLRTAPEHADYRLLIAGERKKGSESYLDEIQATIEKSGVRGQIRQVIEFVPDEETEVYFKAADVLVLPYTLVFQSGVLFLAYSFGLPVIASNVGSFAEDILEGQTGFVYEAGDNADMARTIDRYFASRLYAELAGRRPEIAEYARRKHSWETVGQMTHAVYAGLLSGRSVPVYQQ